MTRCSHRIRLRATTRASSSMSSVRSSWGRCTGSLRCVQWRIWNASRPRSRTWRPNRPEQNQEPEKDAEFVTRIEAGLLRLNELLEAQGTSGPFLFGEQYTLVSRVWGAEVWQLCPPPSYPPPPPPGRHRRRSLPASLPAHAQALPRVRPSGQRRDQAGPEAAARLAGGGRGARVPHQHHTGSGGVCLRLQGLRGRARRLLAVSSLCMMGSAVLRGRELVVLAAGASWLNQRLAWRSIAAQEVAAVDLLATLQPARPAGEAWGLA